MLMISAGSDEPAHTSTLFVTVEPSESPASSGASVTARLRPPELLLSVGKEAYGPAP